MRKMLYENRRVHFLAFYPRQYCEIRRGELEFPRHQWWD